MFSRSYARSGAQDGTESGAGKDGAVRRRTVLAHPSDRDDVVAAGCAVTDSLPPTLP
ncbi:hypothetical protein [Modestobacter sp. SYSU DS0875]